MLKSALSFCGQNPVNFAPNGSCMHMCAHLFSMQVNRDQCLICKFWGPGTKRGDGSDM